MLYTQYRCTPLYTAPDMDDADGGDPGHGVVALLSQSQAMLGLAGLCVIIHLLIRDPGSSVQVVVSFQRQINSISFAKRLTVPK